MDQSGAKFGQTGGIAATGKSNVTINNSGVSPDLLNQLVGSLAQPPQTATVVTPIPTAVDTGVAPGPVTPAPTTDQSTAGASAPTPTKTYLILGGIILAAVAALFLFNKIKL